MIKIALVEDVKEERKALRSIIEDYASDNSLSFSIEEFSTADDFLSKFHKDFDLIFEDIEMPGIDGLEAMKKLRQVDSDVVIIFVTNISRLVIESYKVKALDYVLKPFSKEEILLALTNALRRINNRKRIRITIKDGENEIVLSSTDITYIEVLGHSLIYHVGEKRYTEWGSLSKVEEKLTPLGFVKCNKSYLVNLKYVEDVTKDEVTVFGDKIKIGKTKYQSFLDAYNKYLAI